MRPAGCGRDAFRIMKSRLLVPAALRSQRPLGREAEGPQRKRERERKRERGRHAAARPPAALGRARLPARPGPRFGFLLRPSSAADGPSATGGCCRGPYHGSDRAMIWSCRPCHDLVLRRNPTKPRSGLPTML